MFRVLLVAAFALVTVMGCGSSSKEVTFEGPTEEERAAQMENMSPEQQEAVQNVLDAVRVQTQENAPVQQPTEE
jgi:hypothetical protein